MYKDNNLELIMDVNVHYLILPIKNALNHPVRRIFNINH